MYLIKNLTNRYNIIELLLLVIALLVPLEKTSMRFMIVVISIVTLVKGNYSLFLNKINWIKLGLTLLWILPFLQLFLQNKLNQNWSHLETKLSLLLFPLFIVIGTDLKKKFLFDIFKIFIFGCCISIILCLANSIYNFLLQGEVNYFYYKKISFLHHPGYYSMYLNFATGLLYLNLLNPIKNHKIQISWSWIIIIIFSFFIILISSRTGWITNIIINGVFIFTITKRKKFNRRHWTFMLIIGFSIAGLISLSSPLKNRFNEIIKHTFYAEKQSNYPSSTSTRIKAWEATVELAKKNWLFGLGTGYGGKELNKIYRDKGYFSLKKKNINPHNQYLQYLLDHGIIGIILLFFLTIVMFIISLKEKNYDYTIFLLIMILNFTTESVLETQSGIVFFSLFNTLFFFQWLDKKQHLFDQ